MDITKSIKKRHNMHCPLCGGFLELVPLEKNENHEQHEEYKCVGKGCFKEDYPLYYHHPFRGPYSAPGDSWSLSWVK